MLVKDKIGNVKLNGIQKISTFNINVNAKSFEILSSDLYSDKITAIIRELSTNASDAHIEANNKEPFRVYLPNALDSTFKIRDYGTGMSRDKIEKLYSTYFDSDKSHSDEFTGCLGLGSKSPLAYTDNFSLTSFHNGYRHEYMIYKSNVGIPSLGYVGSVLCDKHSGIEISFAVKSTDFTAFTKKAKKVFLFFSEKPTLYGIDKPKYDEFYSYKGEHISVYKNSEIKNIRGFYAVMGNIGYPIDRYIFFRVPNVLLNQYDKTICLNINMGDLDILPSREGLQDTEKTKRTIKDKFKKAIQEIKRYTEQKVKDSKSYLEANYTYNSICNNIINISLEISNISWQNKRLIGNDNLLLKNKIGIVYGNGCKFIYYKDRIIRLPYKVVIIYNDKMGGHVKLAKYLYDNQTENTLYLLCINLEEINELKQKLLLVDSDILTMTEAIKKYPDAFKCNNIGDITTKLFNISYYGDVSQFVSFCGVKSKRANYKYWTSIKNLPDKEKIYVIISRGRNKQYNNETIRIVISNLKSLTGKTVILYGIKSQSTDKVKSITLDKSWVTLQSYVWQQLKIAVSDIEIQKYHSYKNNKEFIEKSYDDWTTLTNKHYEILSDDSIIKQYLEANKEYNTINKGLIKEKYNCILYLQNEFKLDKFQVDNPIPDYKINVIKNEDIIKKYPILKLIRLPGKSYSYQNNYEKDQKDLKEAKKNIVDYVKMVDERNKI